MLANVRFTKIEKRKKWTHRKIDFSEEKLREKNLGDHTCI